MVALLFFSIPIVYAGHSSEGTVSQTMTIGTFGKDAQSFASLVAANGNFKAVSNTVYGCVGVVISDLSGVEIAQVLNALQKNAVVVAMNLPLNNGLISAPTLQQRVTNEAYSFDSRDGSMVSQSSILGTEEIICPQYWISVIRYSKYLSSFSYATIVDSSELHESILKTAVSKTVEELLPSVSVRTPLTNSAETTFSANDFPGASGEWIKRYEASDTWALGGSDQLVTRHEVFSLKYWDEVVQKEYWRTDTYIDHWLPSYVQQQGHCGPYMSTRTLVVDGDSCEIYDYDPVTTATDVGVSVGISFTVSTGGVGMNIGYSWSWTNPGVRYDTSPDYLNARMQWVETFRGPDYTWWPFYGGPTEPSHNSYRAKTTVIMRTPLGNGYYQSQLKSQWVKYDDTMTWDWWNPFIWWLHRTIYTYTDTWTPGQLASIFKCTLKIDSHPTTDYYSRSHGLAVDWDLPEGWWNYQGYQFLVTSQAFVYTRTLYLLPGTHYVEYAASGYVPNYAWHAKIYINNVLIAEGDVGRQSANHLRGYFTTWWV